MKTKVQQIPLWRQLQAAATVILAVRGGNSGTAAIDKIPSELRPGVQAITFHAWRNMGRAEALRDLLVKKRPGAPVDSLLCLALALVWNDDDAIYEPHTLVNQSVEAAKGSRDLRSHANFLNACLRRFLREKFALVSATEQNPVAAWNHPMWWIQKLQNERPGQWQSILHASNTQAPMTLRTNLRHTTPTRYHALLEQQGFDARLDPSGTIFLKNTVPVLALPGFTDGDVSVQDAAAQLAADLLSKHLKNHPSPKILDACAAPGGKTGHLLELLDAQVTALEIDAGRSTKIHQNLQRLGQIAKVQIGDATKPDSWWSGELFDAILLDAPCTASGIVRRHPDVRWLRRESDIEQLAGVQKQLLQTMWALLKPNGFLLYCTCSVFKAEGEQQAQTFLVNNTNAALLPSPGHLMPQNGVNTEVLKDNHPGNHDGFFYALFQKQSAKSAC
jgi:16S rRNA (cytosine967-C5)-methyltransferase